MYHVATHRANASEVPIGHIWKDDALEFLCGKAIGDPIQMYDEGSPYLDKAPVSCVECLTVWGETGKETRRGNNDTIPFLQFLREIVHRISDSVSSAFPIPGGTNPLVSPASTPRQFRIRSKGHELRSVDPHRPIPSGSSGESLSDESPEERNS